jgi:hypothetical protein
MSVSRADSLLIECYNSPRNSHNQIQFALFILHTIRFHISHHRCNLEDRKNLPRVFLEIIIHAQPHLVSLSQRETLVEYARLLFLNMINLGIRQPAAHDLALHFVFMRHGFGRVCGHRVADDLVVLEYLRIQAAVVHVPASAEDHSVSGRGPDERRLGELLLLGLQRQGQVRGAKGSPVLVCGRAAAEDRADGQPDHFAFFVVWLRSVEVLVRDGEPGPFLAVVDVHEFCGENE